MCLIRIYRWVLSPAKAALFGPVGRCRFSPSCSEYALEAVRRHGAWGGGWLAVKRLARCHPWGGCGLDPVPAARAEPDQGKSPLVEGPRCFPRRGRRSLMVHGS
ncbi:MAG: membrane protein insertion efficiency factor YidD [Verrucomicrobiia bacterium]